MKNLLAGILLLGFALSANGATFNFSYDFWNGSAVTGTFDGTRNNNLVEGLSNISMYFDGVAFDGPLFAQGWNGSDWVAGTAVASFDGLANDFLFIDSNYPTDTLNWTNHFFMQSTDVIDYAAYWLDRSQVSTYNSEFTTAARWSLSEEPAASVPEASSLYFLAFGLLGLFGAARRKA